MITSLDGPDYGIARNENHVVVEWTDGDKKVVFSFTRHGKAISAHFACPKTSLRQVKPAIVEFSNWVQKACPWMEYLVAQVRKPSVKRIMPKCGFDLLAIVPEGDVFYRRTHGIH